MRPNRELGGADGQRGRAGAGPGDAPVARAGRAVVAGRRDDERVEIERARDGLGIRPVAEGVVRLGHADDGDSSRVVRVPVAVRVDGALEAGDQLIGSPVDGPAARRIPLPAGDADREHGCARARRHGPLGRP